MSKKKQKKKNKKKLNKITITYNSTDPKVFFKKIGIRPLTKPGEEGYRHHIEQEVLKRCGQDTFNQLALIYENENADDFFSFYHSNLKLAKIWYGADFYRLCSIAGRLAELPVPKKSKILDVGGGPGHFAFWMANIWDVSSIMVTDPFPDVGSKWAGNIKERRVSFINSRLPELNEIGEEKFDVVVLSRVLSFMSHLNLPQEIQDVTIDSYLQSKEGHRIFAKLETIGNRLKDLVKSDGQVIIVDSWSGARVLLVGKAFETVGLYIDIKRFLPEKVGVVPSVIVFTESIEPVPLKDLPYSLSTVVGFPIGPPAYIGTAACSMRNLFKDGEIKDRFEFESDDKKIKKYNEMVEKEGLLLVFKADNQGIKNAWIYPSICILGLLRNLDAIKDELTKENCGKIYNSINQN